MGKTKTDTAVSQTKATFCLLLTTLLWGGSFVFNKIGFREIPPVTFLFLRFLLATVIMGTFCMGRLAAMNREVVRKGALIGLALASANLSFVLGVNGTTVSRAGFLNNLFVLLVPLVCFFLWRSGIDRWTFAGICLAVFGLFALAGGSPDGFNRGDLLSTICAFFISLHIITVSRLLKDEDVYLVSLVQFATVALIGGILTVLSSGGPFHPGMTSLGALVYCAVFPTVICFTLQNRFQRYTTPTKAGLIYTLDPIWSMLGGFALLGERLSGKEWTGCLLIFMGVLLPVLVKTASERNPAIPCAQTSGSGK